MSEESQVKLQLSDGGASMKLSSYFQSDSNSGTFFDTISSVTVEDTGAGKVSGIPENLSSSKTVEGHAVPVCTLFSGDTPGIPDFEDSGLADDPFTVSVQSSEIDRRHDAWVPSERTKQVLLAINTSPPGTYFAEKDCLTMPGTMLRDEMLDPVKQLVSHYSGEATAAKRNTLTADQVTQDDRGLRQLIQAGCYCAAVNLTGRLLAMYGQGLGKAGHPSKHTAHSLQLWFVRLSLLVKLRQCSIADLESEAFETMDNPDLFFEFSPELNGGRKGSMVPFSMRLLVSRIPQFLGRYKEALDRLYNVLSTVELILDNLSSGLSEDGSPLENSVVDNTESLKLWEKRKLTTLFCIANCTLAQKDFELTAELVTDLLEKANPNSLVCLYSAIGRIYLQMGDIATAQIWFDKASDSNPVGVDACKWQLNCLVDKAYVAIAQNDFNQAHDCFAQALQIDPQNPTFLNNLAVTLVYQGKLRDAVTVLENAVNSPACLHDGLLQNLSSLYELQSSQSSLHKQALLLRCSQSKGDGFNVTCFKFYS